MGCKIEFETFSLTLEDDLTPLEIENIVNSLEAQGFKLKEKPKGVWFVYGYDTMPFPLYMSNNEDHVNAYMAGEGLPYHPWKVFWPHGMSFNNLINNAERGEITRSTRRR